VLKVTNANRFIKGIEVFQKQLNKSVSDFYRGWTVKMYRQAVWTTPQWTGNAASNWNYGVGTIDTSYTSAKLKSLWKEATQVHKRGDEVAVQESFIRNKGKDTAVVVMGGKLPDIFISNHSKSLSGESYAGYLEENPNNFLRTVNEPGHMLQAVRYKFGSLGRIPLKAVRSYSGIRI
jgi:hypothetical protein